MVKAAQPASEEAPEDLPMSEPPVPVAALDLEPTAGSKASAALEAWFVAHIHDSTISRNTRLYNEVLTAKEHLRGFLGRLDD